jgi:hypothetical protein
MINTSKKYAVVIFGNMKEKEDKKEVYKEILDAVDGAL